MTIIHFQGKQEGDKASTPSSYAYLTVIFPRNFPLSELSCAWTVTRGCPAHRRDNRVVLYSSGGYLDKWDFCWQRAGAELTVRYLSVCVTNGQTNSHKECLGTRDCPSYTTVSVDLHITGAHLWVGLSFSIVTWEYCVNNCRGNFQPHKSCLPSYFPCFFFD